MTERLSDVIQSILAEQRRLNPNLYEVSPGQIPSHVDHRVASLLCDPLMAHIRVNYIERARLRQCPSAVNVNHPMMHYVIEDEQQ